MGKSGYEGQAEREREALGERAMSDEAKFRITLLVSITLAIFAVAAEIMALAGLGLIGQLAGAYFVVCLFLSPALFVGGAIRFGLKGMLLAVPMILVWAVPIKVVIDLQTCEMARDWHLCMP